MSSRFHRNRLAIFTVQGPEESSSRCYQTHQRSNSTKACITRTNGLLQPIQVRKTSMKSNPCKKRPGNTRTRRQKLQLSRTHGPLRSVSKKRCNKLHTLQNPVPTMPRALLRWYAAVQVECAHIMPFSMGKFKSSTERFIVSNMWANMYHYFPGLLRLFHGDVNCSAHVGFFRANIGRNYPATFSAANSLRFVGPRGPDWVTINGLLQWDLGSEYWKTYYFLGDLYFMETLTYSNEE